jgi:hypothetical protein
MLKSKRINMNIKRALITFALMLPLRVLAADVIPIVSVTDLAYTEEAAEYFNVTKAKGKSSLNVNKEAVVSTQDAELKSITGFYKKIEQKELIGFTNDIKGKLIKSKSFKLIQGKKFDKGVASPTKAEQVYDDLNHDKLTRPVKMPEVHDIVARIKNNEFNGADFVLFGVLTDINFREELSPIQGTDNATRKFSLELGANFSLINTKTLEITSSFTATGSASEIKILSMRGDFIPPNQNKLIKETSLLLADNVLKEMMEQLNGTESSEPQSLDVQNAPTKKQDNGQVTRIR